MHRFACGTSFGSLLGLACGDAVGTSVEFSSRGSFPPVTDMTGGGPFKLAPGQWTDDTSMALCLAESLLAKSGFDAADQMTRYLNWREWAYWGSTGQCFDIGTTVSEALREFQRTGNPFAGPTDRMCAGNGSLMRLAPVVLFAHPDRATAIEFAAMSSRTTHGAAEAVECCQLFAALLHGALRGDSLESLARAVDLPLTEPAVAALAEGRYLDKSIDEIRGSGYCVGSLEAALWCFHHTDSLEAAVLAAVNLGEDADTTGAIVGQIAGAHYGVEGIPARWLERLHRREEIGAMRRGCTRRADTRISNDSRQKCVSPCARGTPRLVAWLRMLKPPLSQMLQIGFVSCADSVYCSTPTWRRSTA